MSKEVEETIVPPTPEDLGLEATSTQEEANQSQETSPEADASGELEVPEKWRGKSVKDVINAYDEAQKAVSRIGSEKAQKEKEADEMRQRYQFLEQQYQQLSQRQPYQTPVEEIPDPTTSLEEDWDKDPKEAVKKALAASQKLTLQAKSRFELEQRQRDAQSYYTKQKTENQDFAKRETDMMALAQRFGHIVKDEFRQSPEFLEALHFAARGLKVDEYTKEAIEAAKKKGDLVRDEKRKAFSEGSAPSGEATIREEDMTLAQLEEKLGIPEKYRTPKRRR